MGESRDGEPLDTLLAQKLVTTLGSEFALATPMRRDWFTLLGKVFDESKVFLRVCWLKAIAGAWCTTHRMHEDERWPCIFGCDAQDTLCHYLECPVLWHFATSILGSEDAIFVADRLCLREPSVQKLRRLAMTHMIYHSCKNDSEVRHLMHIFVNVNVHPALDVTSNTVGGFPRIETLNPWSAIQDIAYGYSRAHKFMLGD